MRPISPGALTSGLESVFTDFFQSHGKGEICFQMRLGEPVPQARFPSLVRIGVGDSESIYFDLSRQIYVTSRFIEISELDDVGESIGRSFTEVLESLRSAMVSDWRLPVDVPVIFVAEEAKYSSFQVFEVSKGEFIHAADSLFKDKWTNKNGGIWYDGSTLSIMRAVFEKGAAFREFGIQAQFYLAGSGRLCNSLHERFRDHLSPPIFRP
jgi:hypothetical protein